MDDNVVDLSKFKTDSPAAEELTDGERRDAMLLAMCQSLGKQLARLEAEQTAMDENMQHIALALQSIVEAAAAKLKIAP